MTTLHERVSRGLSAERELPSLRVAIAAVRAGLLEEIALSEPAHAPWREQLYAAVRTLPMIEALLIKAINDGALAQAEIERIMREQD